MDEDDLARGLAEGYINYARQWDALVEESRARLPEAAEDEHFVQLAISLAGLDVERADVARGVRVAIADYLGFVLRDRPDILDEAIRQARSDEPSVRGGLFSNDRALVVLTEAKRIRDKMTND
jgi:hypothetical protein